MFGGLREIFYFLLLTAVFFSGMTQKVWSKRVCIIDMSAVTWSTSLFQRGILDKHGTLHNYTLVTPRQGCDPSEFDVRVRMVNQKQLPHWCLGEEQCIVVGDNKCKAPALNDMNEFRKYISKKFDSDALIVIRHHDDILLDLVQILTYLQQGHAREFYDALSESSKQHGDVDMRLKPNVFLRYFYSSKYSYPTIPLGPRADFVFVSKAERDGSKRKFIFNFMGNIEASEDRADLKKALSQKSEWSGNAYMVKYFTHPVQQPNASVVAEYRQTLLQSYFTLVPLGKGDDSFRFWEAMEAGSIPIMVKRKRTNDPSRIRKLCPDGLNHILKTNPPIVEISSWDKLHTFIQHVSQKDIKDLYGRLNEWNKDWWKNTTRKIDHAFSQAGEDQEMAKSWLQSTQEEFIADAQAKANQSATESQTFRMVGDFLSEVKDRVNDKWHPSFENDPEFEEYINARRAEP
jgi:hypothetical protein